MFNTPPHRRIGFNPHNPHPAGGNRMNMRPDHIFSPLVRAGASWHNAAMNPPLTRSAAIVVLILLSALSGPPARAAVLWSLPGPVTVHENGAGQDILGGAVKRNAKDGDVLYFRFRVNPLTDVSKEEYSAGFQLFDGDTERLGMGNSLKAWAYCAFNTEETGENNKVFGDLDLHSANPESYEPGSFLAYELPRRGIVRTIIFKVQFIPGGDDLVTAWIDPDLSSEMTEDNQLTTLTTHFRAKAKFNQIRLRHHGGGDGWTFSDMAVATSFEDFIVLHFWQQWWFLLLVAVAVLVAVGTTVRVVEKRKFQLKLQRAEQAHALERERGRIAQDLHDELGAALTQISLLSGLLRADKDNPALVTAHAAKLADSADQSVRALEEIVWAVRPGSDTLQSLVDYITHFASDLFAGNAIRCRLDLPVDLPARALPPDVRHNIFLIVKEALTNVLKHAGGSVVHLQIKTDAEQLKIIIADDGKGYMVGAIATDGENNGLENMRRRATAVGGQLEVTSKPGKGTRVAFKVNLPG
jgi:signal transduction histidine kinase